MGIVCQAGGQQEAVQLPHSHTYYYVTELQFGWAEHEPTTYKHPTAKILSSPDCVPKRKKAFQPASSSTEIKWLN